MEMTKSVNEKDGNEEKIKLKLIKIFLLKFKISPFKSPHPHFLAPPLNTANFSGRKITNFLGQSTQKIIAIYNASRYNRRILLVLTTLERSEMLWDNSIGLVLILISSAPFGPILCPPRIDPKGGITPLGGPL
jgi:hypothetical protein